MERNSSAAWRHYIKMFQESPEQGRTLINHLNPPLELVRKSIYDPGERAAALVYAETLPTEAKMEIFPRLLGVAASDGGGLIGFARTIILSLPHEWLLANIETYAEAILTFERPDPYWEYRRLLELYIQIDATLTQRLAVRAAQDDDPDIREAGEDFLELLDR